MSSLRRSTGLLLFFTLLCAARAPVAAVSIGLPLPPPPMDAEGGGDAPVVDWLQQELVVWYFFDPADAAVAQALPWLAVPSDGGRAFRVVAVPLGSEPVGGLPESVSLLPGGSRWLPQLGPGVRAPAVLLTRPPGVVAAIFREADAQPDRLPLLALALHVQREDWAAVAAFVTRAGMPLTDPTLHAARASAAVATGDLTGARDEAAGLAAYGPSAGFKAVGQALQARLARRRGDIQAAHVHASSVEQHPEGQAELARLALIEGDTSAAAAAAARAVAGTPTLPWAAGTYASLAAHIALLRDRPATAVQYAKDATGAAPASWRAWQTLGLAQLRAGDSAGVELLQAAAVLAPDSSGAARLGTAARALVEQAGDTETPLAAVVLEHGSIPDTDWAGAGPTACVLLADALQDPGGASEVVCGTGRTAGKDGSPFGGGLNADTARRAARSLGARYLILLRMQVASEGVVLNVRTVDLQADALRGLDSMLWAPDQTLQDACTALAHRLRPRIRPTP